MAGRSGPPCPTHPVAGHDDGSDLGLPHVSRGWAVPTPHLGLPRPTHPVAGRGGSGLGLPHASRGWVALKPRPLTLMYPAPALLASRPQLPDQHICLQTSMYLYITRTSVVPAEHQPACKPPYGTTHGSRALPPVTKPAGCPTPRSSEGNFGTPRNLRLPWEGSELAAGLLVVYHTYTIAASPP